MSCQTICGQVSKLMADELNYRINSAITKETLKNPDFGKAILSATPEQLAAAFGKALRSKGIKRV